MVVSQNQIGPKIGTKGIEPYYCQYGAISNNFIWDFGDHGIALSGATNFDVCNNIFMPYTNSAHTGAYAISVASGKYNDLWNNIIFQAAGVSSTKMGIGVYTPPGYLAYANRFVNNTIALLSDPTEGGTGNAIAWGNNTGMTKNIVYENNIVYRCVNAFGASGIFYYSSYATNCTFAYNNFFCNTISDTPMAKQTGGVTTQTTVAGFVPDSGMVYTGNTQLEPAFTGGTLPSGLDANWRPNTAYFTLSSSSPSAIKSTGNSLSGGSLMGYNHSSTKFNLDIVGNPRSAWSMGAYEYGGAVAPPPPTGLHVIAGP